MIYLDDLGGQAADFLIGLLGQFTSKYKSDPEIGLVSEYDFRSVFKCLNRTRTPDAALNSGTWNGSFSPSLKPNPQLARYMRCSQPILVSS
ncbi:MAG: hypothetical protein ACLPKE_30570 [Streptosporangiaceae bacterium]